jgi:SAM-dependent methyltransferase
LSGVSTLCPELAAPRPALVSCPLCGADQARLLYRSERPFMRIVRCRPCGMMYQNPQVAEAGMEDAYQSFEEYGRYASLEEGKRKLFESRIRRFERQWRLPEEGAFLDVGASRGAMLDAVKTLLPKWRLAGVEISPSARAALLARGYSALPGIEALDAAAKFDWINLDNVLEHMPAPGAILKRLKAHLNPGGFIYIDVPNESFFSLRYRINDVVRGFRKPPTFPGHVNLFTPRTLKQLFSNAECRCERFWMESISAPHRLSAVGAAAAGRTRMILDLLRATRLDIGLRAAYFLCARIQAA